VLQVRGDAQLSLAMDHAVARRRAEAELAAAARRIAALDARLAAARPAAAAAARERAAEAVLARRVAEAEWAAAATARERDRVAGELRVVRAAAGTLLRENQARWRERRREGRREGGCCWRELSVLL
jgi:hypothetical protein